MLESSNPFLLKQGLESPRFSEKKTITLRNDGLSGSLRFSGSRALDPNFSAKVPDWVLVREISQPLLHRNQRDFIEVLSSFVSFFFFNENFRPSVTCSESLPEAPLSDISSHAQQSYTHPMNTERSLLCISPAGRRGTAIQSLTEAVTTASHPRSPNAVNIAVR